MGNTSKKLAAKCTLLTKDEQKYVANTFRTASKNSDRIREDDLIVSRTVDPESIEKYWGPLIDPRLAQYLTNFLFMNPTGGKSQTCDFNRFAELYVYNVRGTSDERMMVLYNSLGQVHNEGTELSYQLLREYCESIASTYIKMLKASSCKHAHAWIKKGFKGMPGYVQALGECLAATVSTEDDSTLTFCDARQLHRWLLSNTLLKQLSEFVFVNLYGIDKHEDGESPPPSAELPASQLSLLPRPEGLDAFPDYPAFIDLAHIVWLNSHLPLKHQNKWRFLFSTHIHGQSFSTMAGRIQEQGPSIVIVMDNSGYIFGGYASDPWAIGPNFCGTTDNFLFTLSPKMRLYESTTYNNHYQYINHHTKTLPNGLQMGGQLEFGGIWINADPFGEGSSSDTCITYRGYKRLSKDPTFRIKSLEVWGVGEKPASLKEEGERDTSILDKNPEAKAILDMAGRTRHSEGIREPPPL